MRTDLATAILEHLRAVDAVRTAARHDGELSRWFLAVKRYQGARFQRTYADLLHAQPTQRAGRFFLTELYGDRDYSRRDAEFARIVPRVKRMFSDDLLQTLERLSALHALSESLDLAMARSLRSRGRDLADPGSVLNTLSAANYLQAWQTVSTPAQRSQQIDWVGDVGLALATLTKRVMLRHTLKLMRVPAQAAGLGALQHFLEEGFDAFAALPDAPAFVATVVGRERNLAQRLFEASALPALAAGPQADDPLGQLPLRVA
jgi:hypothetical protein